ncbi:MAG: DoxX family membrane protein [Chloroflexi bacterium]|nr:DoxX family membrane protein [Chloroflexota bacterium]
MEETRSSRIGRFFANSYLHLALRLFIGGLFLLSAVSKLPHHTEFEAVVKDYDLLPDALATAYANALPWAELLVGVYLVLGVLIRPSAAVSILMGLTFLTANVSAIGRGAEHCGNCFGDVWSLPVWEALVIDIALLIAASLLLFMYNRTQRIFTLDRLAGRRIA